MKNKISIGVAYILVAAFTYGYAYWNDFNFQNKSYLNYNEASHTVELKSEALVCSAIWPLYWPFHLSRVLWNGKESK